MRKVLVLVVAVWGLSVDALAQIPDFTPKTPLIGALLHNDAGEARRLLDGGADPNDGRFVGFAPVFLAIQRQDVELVRLLVARGADLSVRDSSGSTALMWATFNEAGDAILVQELLKLGADPVARNNVGETALDWARRRGDTPAVAALRRSGASDEASVKASVEKALMLLQRSGSPPAGKLLIPLERRDVRVVEGARLESEACEEHRGTRRDLNAHALNELAAWKYLSV